MSVLTTETLLGGLVIISVISFILLLIILIKIQSRLSPEHIELAVNRAWQEIGIGEKVERLDLLVNQVRDFYKSIEQMLRVPKERAQIGEIGLEEILKDQLPPDLFGIRKKLPNGTIPDAYIKSTDGYICIDSKFPLEKYAKMQQSNNDEEKRRLLKGFLKDVEKHLEKVASTYIKPYEGTAPFAFVYIPSEAVYWLLVSEIEGYELLRRYVKKGVQVVSPLTLSHKIDLIKAGLAAKKLSEETEEIKNMILRLSDHFENLYNNWNTVYNNHFKNFSKKLKEVNANYQELKEEIENIRRLFK